MHEEEGESKRGNTKKVMVTRRGGIVPKAVVEREVVSTIKQQVTFSVRNEVHKEV